jgi:hypothetical protein
MTHGFLHQSTCWVARSLFDAGFVPHVPVYTTFCVSKVLAEVSFVLHRVFSLFKCSPCARQISYMKKFLPVSLGGLDCC